MTSSIGSTRVNEPSSKRRRGCFCSLQLLLSTSGVASEGTWRKTLPFRPAQSRWSRRVSLKECLSSTFTEEQTKRSPLSRPQISSRGSTRAHECLGQTGQECSFSRPLTSSLSGHVRPEKLKKVFALRTPFL